MGKLLARAINLLMLFQFTWTTNLSQLLCCICSLFFWSAQPYSINFAMTTFLWNVFFSKHVYEQFICGSTRWRWHKNWMEPFQETSFFFFSFSSEWISASFEKEQKVSKLMKWRNALKTVRRLAFYWRATASAQLGISWDVQVPV